MKALKCKTILMVILGLLAWSEAGTTAQAATLVLISLTCHEPEDANWDEPEIVVSTGGGTTSFQLSSMTRGSTVPRARRRIGRILMDGQATVILYDRDNGRNDWFDADDDLGLHAIQDVATNGVRTLTFNGDGANYTLSYRVDP